MNKRYSLVCRGGRGATFYIYDSLTGKRQSLGTKNRAEAQRLIEAKNDALRQPVLNLNIAKAYLAGADSGFGTRTWQQALDALIETKQGETKARWLRAAKDKALVRLQTRIISETQPDLLLEALRQGTVSTNVHLRKLHNFCLDMGWLPWPIIPKKQWPEIRFGSRRAITREEHERIVQNETNPERKAFYELCWHLGGAQSDVANLCAEDIDWQGRTISFRRAKTDVPAIIHFGEAVETLLTLLPAKGPLFPAFRLLNAAHRATEFRRQCRRIGVSGVTLHSYRYAWAERAKECGYPERYAMQALGHSSKAVHRAYAKNVQMKLPSLEEYEQRIVPMPEKKAISAC
jgi:integrase